MRLKKLLLLVTFIVLFAGVEASLAHMPAQNTPVTAASIRTFENDTMLRALKVGNRQIAVMNFAQLEKLLNKKDNKTYVINFWATWCAPCVKEIPYFEKLGQTYKNKNVEVILLSMDFPNKADNILVPFLEKKQYKNRIILLDDPNQNTWIPKVSKEWSGALPATLIYNKKKREFYEQSFTYEELEAVLLKNMK